MLQAMLSLETHDVKKGPSYMTVYPVFTRYKARIPTYIKWRYNVTPLASQVVDIITKLPWQIFNTAQLPW